MRARPRLPVRRGFTLVEIILVVAILAMIAAFAIPSLMSQSEDTKLSLAKTQVKNLTRDLGRYQLNSGSYPSTEQGLKALVEKPEEEPVPKKWVQTIEELPKDPWDRDYMYVFPGEHNGEKKPDIWSVGPDGEDGTDDDIGNWTDESKEGESAGTEK